MTLEYRQSLKEVNLIIGLMEKQYIDKIPSKLLNFIKENMDNSYVCNINTSEPINKQNIKKDTKILLSILYRNYWCSKEEKKKLISEDIYLKNKEEEEKKSKYNIDKIFENKKKNNINENDKEKSMMIESKKEGIFRKILNKIIKLFKIK